jgi:hypothetical protein
MKLFRDSLLSALLLVHVLTTRVSANSSRSPSRPKQGVFLLSNQRANEVGVYESLENGSLSWVGRYPTGGIGYPDPTDEGNLDDLGSSNSLHYHVWAEKQWLTAVNAGGPEGEGSVSLLEINPTTLELSSANSQLQSSTTPVQGVFPCSVAAFGDRVCVATCAATVTMECFRIDPDTFELKEDFIFDFGANSPPREGRPNAVIAFFGPTNLLFSDDGLQIGLLMKGDACGTECGLGPANEPNEFSVPPAGFHVWPVIESGYGTKAFLELPDASLPFAFTWRSGEVGTNKQVALVVNIAGENNDVTEALCDLTSSCRSSVVSLITDVNDEGEISTLEKVDEVFVEAVDACWIDYSRLHWFTGNFIDDSISIGTVQRDGTLTWERTVPIGRGQIANNIMHMGLKIDGSLYIYTENQGSATIGVNHAIEYDGFNPSTQLQIQTSAPYPDGITNDPVTGEPNAWNGAMGLATTLLSEEELFAMYDYADGDAGGESSGASPMMTNAASLFYGLAVVAVANAYL